MAKDKILFIDNNLGLGHAVRLAQAGNEVFYAPQMTVGAYPKLHEMISGYGYPVTLIDDMGEYLRDVSYVYIVDCFAGGLADSIREAHAADGKLPDCYGPSKEWTNIENDRVYGWNALKKMGVGVPDGKVVKGADGVVKYVEENEDMSTKDPNEKKPMFIKISKYRGNYNSKAVKTPLEASVAMSQAGFGPFVGDMEFLIQKVAPGIEMGADRYFNGRDFLWPYFLTCEIKGSGTVARVMYDRGILDDILFDRVKKSLADSRYRGNISFEFFWDGKGIMVHDPCARDPFPCSSMNPRYITNFPEVVAAIARGEDIELEMEDDYEYMAQITVATDDEKLFRPIRFPKDMEKDIGFRRVAIKDGDCWFVPGDSVIATAMSHGDDPEEALTLAGDVAREIDCDSIYFDGDFIPQMKDTIAKINSMGDKLKF